MASGTGAEGTGRYSDETAETLGLMCEPLRAFVNVSLYGSARLTIRVGDETTLMQDGSGLVLTLSQGDAEYLGSFSE